MAYDRIGKSVELERVSGKAPQVPAVITTYSVPPQPSDDAVGLNQVLVPLWRGKWKIAALAIAGILIGAAVSAVMTPTYRAHASLQLEGYNNDQFLREITPISALPNSTPDNYLQNQVKLLESESLAKRVADALGEPSTKKTEVESGGLLASLQSRLAAWRPSLTPEQRRIRDVQKALTVRTSLQSQVIDLFYEDPDPVRAAKGANVVTTEFIDLNREARWQMAQDTTEWLNKQAAELKATLENSNRQLEDFARSAGLVFAGKQDTLAEDRMKQVQDALTKAQADRAAKQARYEAAVANSGSVMSDALATGPMRQYEDDLQKLRRDLAQLETTYTPTNYRIQRVKAQIAETEKSIEDERKKIVERLKTEYAAASGLERLLAEDHGRQLKTVEQQMDLERRYDVKKSEVEATQRLYESMLQRVKEAGAAAAMRATNIRTIDAASVPSVPYSPNSALNMAVGFAIGTLGGAVLVLLRAGSDKVQKPGESIFPEVPELGVIPSAGAAQSLHPANPLLGFRRGRTELGIATRHRNAPLLNESFRAALTSILYGAGSRKLKNAGGRILVVTSMEAMEGKTTVLTNLGMAAAERRQRVLLIDGDLRRPRVHKLVNLTNASGLADLLKRDDLASFAASAPLDSLAQPTRLSNLWALPSGEVNDNSHGLLYSSDMATLLRRFRKEFDLILIDTPPMMLYADGRVLGQMSDGVVMVVRANTRSREELQAAYQQLMQDQIPLLGTILNDWKMDSNLARTYGRYYRRYGQHSA